jgi:transcriptional regulator with XRE-family HTH domain
LKLGEFLKQVRAEKHLTPKAAASLIGVSATHYRNLESGIDSRTKKPFAPSFSILLSTAKQFDISYFKLLDLAGALPEGWTADDFALLEEAKRDPVKAEFLSFVQDAQDLRYALDVFKTTRAVLKNLHPNEQ